MSILVLAEHDNATLKASTLNVIGAARKLGADIHVLVAGSSAANAAAAAGTAEGVTKVIHVDAAHLATPTAENLAAQVVALVREAGYGYVLAPASGFGKNAMPRIAATLDVAQVSEITAIHAPDTFVRPIYAGSVFATVQSRDAVKVITVRVTAFEPVSGTGGNAPIESRPAVADTGKTRVIGQELSRSERPELGGARIVVSGGRALQSAENFALLEKLADKLGAAVGASRAAVDAGYCSNDYQVGQTGKVVAPDLYIAVGISGAIQHLAGMKDSKVIVAINKDPEAPIFQIADYGLVGDLFEIVPRLTEALGR